MRITDTTNKIYFMRSYLFFLSHNLSLRVMIYREYIGRTRP